MKRKRELYGGKSFDGGKTWPVKFGLVEEGSFWAYSSLACRPQKEHLSEGSDLPF